MPPLHEVGSFRHSSPNAMLLLNVPPVAKTAGFRGTHRVVDCRLCRRLLIIAPGGRSNVSFPCFGPKHCRPVVAHFRRLTAVLRCHFCGRNGVD